MRGTRPLAVHHLVEILRIADIGGLHATPPAVRGGVGPSGVARRGESNRFPAKRKRRRTFVQSQERAGKKKRADGPLFSKSFRCNSRMTRWIPACAEITASASDAGRFFLGHRLHRQADAALLVD